MGDAGRDQLLDDERLLAGIELGGTKAIAVLARGRDILERVRVPTTTPGDTLPRLRAQLGGWIADGASPAALGITTFGPVVVDRDDPRHGRIVGTPKPGWSGVDVLGALTDGLDLPTALDTDVSGAALAEGLWGAGRDARAHVYLTVGTGIGGALVVDGRPAHGRAHAEMGHLRLPRAPGGFPGVCPYHGDCIEGLASGPAIAARAGRDAAELGDDHPVWAEVADALAALIAALVLTAAPDRVLLGGGVVMGRPGLVAAIGRAVARRLSGYPLHLAPDALDGLVRIAGLGHDAGPLGAIAVARRAAARA